MVRKASFKINEYGFQQNGPTKWSWNELDTCLASIFAHGNELRDCCDRDLLVQLEVKTFS